MPIIDEGSDKIFLSYKKILYRLNNENITRKDGAKITEMDLRKAIIVMLKKHLTCRWRRYYFCKNTRKKSLFMI
ncbi:MAG: hypothetical protein FWF46_07280 [Oscillospiraceae bacterium]|nr:hypothetical protein [Oscillospiraceae bacterium]